MHFYDTLKAWAHSIAGGDHSSAKKWKGDQLGIAEAEAAILRERIRELEMQRATWQQERQRRLGGQITHHQKTPRQSGSTDVVVHLMSPNLSNPKRMLDEMEGRVDFIEEQRQVLRAKQSQVRRSPAFDKHVPPAYRTRSVHLMEKIIAVEQSNRSLNKELTATRNHADRNLAKLQTNEKAHAQKLEAVSEELASTEAALSICLTLLKSNPPPAPAPPPPPHLKLRGREPPKPGDPRRLHSRFRLQHVSELAITSR